MCRFFRPHIETIDPSNTPTTIIMHFANTFKNCTNEEKRQIAARKVQFEILLETE